MSRRPEQSQNATKNTPRRGRDRISLVHVLAQYQRKEHPKLRRSLDALFREVIATLPNGYVEDHKQFWDIYFVYGEEAPLIAKPPFADIAADMVRITDELPTNDADMDLAWQEIVDGHVKAGEIIIVGEGPRRQTFGLQRRLLMQDADRLYVSAWTYLWLLRNPSHPRGVRTPNPPDMKPLNEQPQECQNYFRAAIGQIRESAAAYQHHLDQQDAAVKAATDAPILTERSSGATSSSAAEDAYYRLPEPIGPEENQGESLTAEGRKDRRYNPDRKVWQLRHLIIPEDGSEPHFAWREDPDQRDVTPYKGPWGDVTIGGPGRPPGSPRESMRSFLTQTGQLDMIYKFAQGPDDPIDPNEPPWVEPTLINGVQYLPNPWTSAGIPMPFVDDDGTVTHYPWRKAWNEE